MDGGNCVDDLKLDLGSLPMKGLCIVRASVRAGVTLIKCFEVTAQRATRRQLMPCHAVLVKKFSA